MGGSNKNNSVYIWLAGLVIVALVSYGLFRYTKRDSTFIDPVFTSTTVNTTPTPMMTPKKMMMPSFSYKDGIYSALGNYFSPGGEEQISVQLTLKNDFVVDAKVESKAFRPNSIKFQGLFISGFKSFVVGKKIDEINLTKVSGSSLTPKGFNDALAKIKLQAKA